MPKWLVGCWLWHAGFSYNRASTKFVNNNHGVKWSPLVKSKLGKLFILSSLVVGLIWNGVLTVIARPSQSSPISLLLIVILPLKDLKQIKVPTMTSMIKYDKYDQVWPSMTPYGHSSSKRTIRQKYQVWQVWPSMTPYGHSSSQRTKRLKVPSITSKLNMMTSRWSLWSFFLSKK